MCGWKSKKGNLPIMSRDEDLHIMPFHVKDFFADPVVEQMDATEIGAYFLMILYNWREGGVPDDPEQLKKICRLPHGIESVPPVVLGKFVTKGARLYNRKVGRVKSEVRKRIKEKKMAARKSALARWQK